MSGERSVGRSGEQSDGRSGGESGEQPEERRVLSLFEGFGIELEYMIVDAETLDVKPIADRLIEAEGHCESVALSGGEPTLDPVEIGVERHVRQLRRVRHAVLLRSPVRPSG